jgi:hypothetical protein
VRAALAAAAALLGACATVAPPPQATPAPAAKPALPQIVLRNASFEEIEVGRSCPPDWWCVMHADPASYRYFTVDGGAPHGKRSVCIERVTNEPWSVIRQLIRHEQLLGATLRVSLSVRVEGATGPGGGPWALVEGRTLVHERTLVNGTRPWASSHVDFTIPRNAEVVVVGATFEGPGKACFDNVRVEVLRLP